MSDPAFAVVVTVRGGFISGEVKVVIGNLDTALVFQMWCADQGMVTEARDVLRSHLPSLSQYEVEAGSILARNFSAQVRA